jgi:hypothetical protein
MALLERFQINVTSDIKRLGNTLSDVERKVLPQTIHDTTRFLTFDLRDLQKKTVKKKFDRPTPWTVNSIRVRYSRRSEPKQFGEVFFAEFPSKGTPAYKYLEPHIFGGQRGQKRHEVALTKMGLLPAGGSTAPASDARLNRYGNITGGTYTKILSQLGAMGEQGYLANQTARSKARAGGRRTQYYVARKGGKAVGVRQRTSKRNTKQILNFSDTRPTYRKRYDFYGISRKFVQQNARTKFFKALKMNMKKRRRR